MTRRTAKDFREALIDAAGYVDFGADQRPGSKLTRSHLRIYRQIADGTTGAFMAPADVRDLLDEIDRLEDKTSGLRTEIAAKVGAYREIKMLEDGIRSIITICEQDARDQDHNATNTSDKRSKAYAEGRGTACRSIATRLRALLPDELER